MREINFLIGYVMLLNKTKYNNVVIFEKHNMLMEDFNEVEKADLVIRIDYNYYNAEIIKNRYGESNQVFSGKELTKLLLRI